MNVKPSRRGHQLRERRYRLAVLARILLAVFGGYAVSSLATIVLSLALPMERVEAVQTATLISFVLMACIALWVFAVKSAWRACIGLSGAAIVLALCWWWLQSMRGGA